MLALRIGTRDHISWQGRRLPIRQRPWPRSPNNLLRTPVGVLAPGRRATVELRWLNWCGPPSETQLVRPVLDLRFAPATELRLRTGPMGPPRCDAPSAPSILYVSRPLQPQ